MMLHTRLLCSLKRLSMWHCHSRERRKSRWYRLSRPLATRRALLAWHLASRGPVDALLHKRTTELTILLWFSISRCSTCKQNYRQSWAYSPWWRRLLNCFGLSYLTVKLKPWPVYLTRNYSVTLKSKLSPLFIPTTYHWLSVADHPICVKIINSCFSLRKIFSANLFIIYINLWFWDRESIIQYE